MFYYLGIDIGGGANTWGVALREAPDKKGLEMVSESLSCKEDPSPISLESIRHFIRQKRVLATAIDAPLSFSLSLEKGWREADKALRALLPTKAKAWVLSYHALMGIPLRAFLLAKAISPYCGSILETHPRASLYFLLPESKKNLAYKYKNEGLNDEEALWLRDFLEAQFSLSVPLSIIRNEGSLDALLCALTAWTYQRTPERLLFLPQGIDLEGYGPFVVFQKGA